MPTCTPILATVAIFSAVGQWNNYQDTLIYITDQKLYSLQYLLYTYINQASSLAAMVRNSGTAAISTAALATQADGNIHSDDSIRSRGTSDSVHLSDVPEIFCKRNHDWFRKRLIFCRTIESKGEQRT